MIEFENNELRNEILVQIDRHEKLIKAHKELVSLENDKFFMFRNKDLLDLFEKGIAHSQKKIRTAKNVLLICEQLTDMNENFKIKHSDIIQVMAANLELFNFD